ncbi:acid phosphatase [Gordonia jinhuaensis]|uniref:Acid phosphatase n=1 Tax=Gordonia jinhuaensis TaxID=1517702 RepID=A0A916T8S2_9ACTN|nr:acid phosphatase [Gordonia jinhuaensis]GGB34668.1 acid phosphatase [Gordonia jinhuaensis]
MTSTQATSAPTHRLLLIRHGETEWSLSGQHTGNTDKPLTENGKRQAQALVKPLEELDLYRPYVISSPRTRAKTTAELAGLSIDAVWDEVHEWDYGDYEGLTNAQIRAENPGWNLWSDGCPGGESVAQMSSRVDGVIDAAIPLMSDRDVVIVSHGHFSRSFLARWVEAPIARGERFQMLPASVAAVGFNGEFHQLMTLGITGYSSANYVDASRPSRPAR